jgi:hypothetical protein
VVARIGGFDYRGRERISGGVNLGRIHQHDWDVVLNRINAPALAAFETVTGWTQHYRLFANWAN